MQDSDSEEDNNEETIREDSASNSRNGKDTDYGPVFLLKHKSSSSTNSTDNKDRKRLHEQTNNDYEVELTEEERREQVVIYFFNTI